MKKLFIAGLLIASTCANAFEIDPKKYDFPPHLSEEAQAELKNNMLTRMKFESNARSMYYELAEKKRKAYFDQVNIACLEKYSAENCNLYKQIFITYYTEHDVFNKVEVLAFLDYIKSVMEYK